MATTTQADRITVSKPTLRERLDMGNGVMPYFLVIPTLLVICIVAIYPIVDSIYLSILDNPFIANPNNVGLANYVRDLGDPQFMASVQITIIFSVISVVIETVLGLGLAMLMNQTFKGRGVLRAVILVPWAFPPVVSGQIWRLMYNDQNGIISYIQQQLHILKPGDTILNTPNGVLAASIATDVWKTTPFMALLLLAGLQVIPSDLYEAASVDGSTRWQQFWTITLPLLRNSLLIALLFRLLDAIRVFDLFYIFTGGGREVQTMSSYSYNLMFQGVGTDFGPGAAAAVLLAILAAIVSLIIVTIMRFTRR
ncbi:MAG: sugar ABC transporter permease [Ktedonobacteraceae bacterium]